MGKTFILVETDEKRQTLQAALKDRFDVLVVPTIAAVVEAKNVDYLARGEEGYLFRPTDASQVVLRKLLAQSQGEICLAFDRSERGEYTSWLWAGMIGQLSKGGQQCFRLLLASLTKEGVDKAMELVEPINSRKAASFYFEECFQRCLANHLERLLGTRLGPGGIPLSIPVLAILELLSDREQEVRKFAGTPKWHVELSMKGARGEFSARVTDVLGICADGILESREQAKEVARDLVGQSFQVDSRQENDLKIPAPQPYTFYELIADAFRYCQVPIGEALEAAFALASGVMLDGRPRTLITSLYPVPIGNVQPFAEAAGRHVVTMFGEDALRSCSLVGHGILPVDPELGPEDISSLSDVLQKVYELIWRRALASQMSAALGKEIVLDLKTEKYRLKSDYRVIEEQGFLAVYQYGFSDLLEVREDETLQEGEGANVARVIPGRRFAGAAALYTLPSLADDLLDLGLVRQDEVVQLLGKLCAAEYIDAQGDGALQCGPLLFKVVNTLNRAFPGMQGLHLIVYYGQTIDEVASGRKRFQMGLKQFDQSLMMQGKPLVKVKLPTTLPKRLKKSKSIIKSDGPPPPREKVAPSAAQATVPFADFGSVMEDGKVQVPVVSVVADNVEEMPVSPVVQADQEDAIVPEPIQEAEPSLAADSEEKVPVEEMEVVPGEEAQGLSGQDDGTVLLDEEADGEQVGVAPSEEAEKLFQEAAEVPETPPVPPEVAAPIPEEQSAPPLQKGETEKSIADLATKPCPECGRTMILKGDRFGEYWACTGAPACRYTEGAKQDESDKAMSCPVCQQGELVAKRTPTGKNMYVCSRKSCEFMAWSKPHQIHCPLCSSPFLVEKKGVSGDVVLRCPKAGCNYFQSGDGGQEQEVPVKKKKVVVRRKKGGGAGAAKRKVVVRRRKK